MDAHRGCKETQAVLFISCFMQGKCAVDEWEASLLPIHSHTAHLHSHTTHICTHSASTSTPLTQRGLVLEREPQLHDGLTVQCIHDVTLVTQVIKHLVTQHLL